MRTRSRSRRPNRNPNERPETQIKQFKERINHFDRQTDRNKLFASNNGDFRNFNLDDLQNLTFDDGKPPTGSKLFNHVQMKTSTGFMKNRRRSCGDYSQ